MTNAAPALQDWVQRPLFALRDLLLQREDWPRGEVELASWLYANWYTRGDRDSVQTKLISPKRLVAQLRAAHVDSSNFEASWVVVESCPALGVGVLRVEHKGLQKVVPAIEYINKQKPFGPHLPGDRVSVTRRRDAVIEGSWRTWSVSWPAGGTTTGVALARVYWSLSTSALPEAAARFTSILPIDYAWALKILIEPSAATRSDATILYFQANDLAHFKPAILELRASLSDLLKGSTPPLTRPIAPSVSVAEDPGGTVSFGEHRCQLIARAVASDPAVLRESSTFLVSLSKVFEAEGMDLRQPDRRARAIR